MEEFERLIKDLPYNVETEGTFEEGSLILDKIHNS